MWRKALLAEGLSRVWLLLGIENRGSQGVTGKKGFELREGRVKEVVFIGNGPMKGELEELAKRLNVENRVIFKEGIPPQDVPLEMQKMDVFVLPSLTRPNWMEQFGRVLIEAMACETPVIGSSSGEIPRVIDNAGLIFPEGNVQELKRCIRKLLDDPGLYAQLATRGRQRVLEHYTQERIALQIYNAYQEMMDK